MGKWVVLPSTRGYITEGTHGYEGLWAVYGGTVGYYWVPCSIYSYPCTLQCPARQNSTDVVKLVLIRSF